MKRKTKYFILLVICLIIPLGIAAYIQSNVKADFDSSAIEEEVKEIENLNEQIDGVTSSLDTDVQTEENTSAMLVLEGNKSSTSMQVEIQSYQALLPDLPKESVEKIGTEGNLIIDLSQTDSTVDTLSILTKNLQDILNYQMDGVEILFYNKAIVTMNRKAIQNVLAQAKGSRVRISLETQKKAKSSMSTRQKQALMKLKTPSVIHMTFSCNNKRLNHSTGEIELQVPYSYNKWNVWSIDEQGRRNSVSSSADRGLVSFYLDKDSYYAVEKHVHNFHEIYYSDTFYHWRACDCGEITEREKHIFTDNICVVCHKKADAQNIKEEESKQRIMVKAKAQKDGIELSWKEDRQASGYRIYGACCDKNVKFKRLKDTKKCSYKVKIPEGKRSYKYYVVPYKKEDGKRVYLTKSYTLHVSSFNHSHTNAKSIEVYKKKYYLLEKESVKIKAKIIKQEKNKPLLEHTKTFRYESSDSSIAKVGKNGKIKAKSEGSCYIYVIANNGVYRKIKVIVKKEIE